MPGVDILVSIRARRQQQHTISTVWDSRSNIRAYTTSDSFAP
jgi:heme-degrading monooxygenase HmoA